jgi:acyl-CoA synthetase (AMP-forming)/AMP-acid ligase II
VLQFGYFLIRNAQCFPDRLAVACKDAALTWRELNEQSNRLANGMGALGIGRGRRRRVAVYWQNCTDWVVLWYACQKLGATPLPLNTRLLPHELARIMRIAACDTLLCGDGYLEEAQELVRLHGGVRLCLARHALPGRPACRCVDWETVMSLGGMHEAQIDLAEDDEAVVLFTSGTTGHSKGVVRTQRMVRDHALVLAIENGSRCPHEVMLTSSALYHAAGLLCVLKMAALAGSLLLADRLDAALVLGLIERYRATQVLMVPPVVYNRLAAYEGWESFDLDSVREVQVSAGPSADGWFATGDWLRKDADGRYFFVGRAQDVIRSGGENVYAQEVEQALLAHPDVCDCAVIGIPDDCYEETIGAAVVPRPGSGLTSERMLAWCRHRLAGYKKPRRWLFVEELPTNSIGKTQKARLREPDVLGMFEAAEGAAAVPAAGPSAGSTAGSAAGVAAASAAGSAAGPAAPLPLKGVRHG